MSNDRDYQRLIHAGRWLRLRRDILNAHPLCADCEREGRVTAAAEVHHIAPVEDAYSYAEKRALMYDPSNLVPLCRECHRKRHMAAGQGTREARAERRKRQHEEILKKIFGEGGAIF